MTDDILWFAVRIFPTSMVRQIAYDYGRYTILGQLRGGNWSTITTTDTLNQVKLWINEMTLNGLLIKNAPVSFNQLDSSILLIHDSDWVMAILREEGQ